METWILSFTDANGRVGTKTYDKETAFISGVLDKLTDLRTSKVSAVLPDGTKLDEQPLRVHASRGHRHVNELGVGERLNADHVDFP